MQAYNVALAMFGLYALASGSARTMRWFLGFLAVSLICDIIFAAVFGNLAVQANNVVSSQTGYPQDQATGVHTQVFGLAMLIINIFVKLPLTFFAVNVFLLLGGNFAASAPPTIAGGPSTGSSAPPATDAYASMPTSPGPSAVPGATAPSSGYDVGSGYHSGGTGYSAGFAPTSATYTTAGMAALGGTSAGAPSAYGAKHGDGFDSYQS